MDGEEKVKRRLRAKNRPTEIRGEVSPKVSEANFFDVSELTFKEEDGEDLSIVISGNEFSIALQASLCDAIKQIVRFEISRLKLNGDSSKSDKIKRSGHPEVRLFFFQKASLAAKGYQPLKGEISFDLMNFVDSPQLPGELIKQADITFLSGKIKELFTNYQWQRGKKIVTYHDWGRGYQLQLQVNTQTEGIKIIQQILKIQNHPFEKKYVKISEPVFPEAKQMPEGEYIIAGRKTKHKRFMPEGEVIYSYGRITLPSSGISIPVG